MPDDDSEDQYALRLLLDALKLDRGTFDIHNFVGLRRDRKMLKPSLDSILEQYQNLYLDGWFIMDLEQGCRPNFVKLSTYGKAQLRLDYLPVFLDPISTITELKKAIPDIDNIILDYYAESLLCLKKRLFFASIVTMGCASERTILLLIEAIQKYYDDIELNKKFENLKNVKLKFELMLQTIKERKLKTELLEQSKDNSQTTERIKNLFIDVDTHLEQMFSIYRINRNDAGHPTGKEFSLDIVRTQAAMFIRYCEVIYSLMSHLQKES